MKLSFIFQSTFLNSSIQHFEEKVFHLNSDIEIVGLAISEKKLAMSELCLISF